MDTAVTNRLITEAVITDAAKRMLAHPQAECPVIHRFGPGIYIRELSMQAGTFAIGHHQKFEHMNIMLKGRVTMLNDDGTTTELVAPMVYVGKPGRKIGYVREDMVWQNIYATTETDVEKLEEMLLDKTMIQQCDLKKISFVEHQEDRSDYRIALYDIGYTDELARAQSENEADQIPFPHGSYKVVVGSSPIDGSGLFATTPIEAGEVIAPARIGGMRTPAGRYTNHAAVPNAEMVALPDGDINLVATRFIGGAQGGGVGEEITIDYRQALRAAIESANTNKEERVLCHL